MFSFKPLPPVNPIEHSATAHSVPLHNARDGDNCATAQLNSKDAPGACQPVNPSSDSGSDDDSEPTIPDDAPRIPEGAQFPDVDYVAPSIVTLQSIIHRLIYNFARDSDVHYRDLLVALGLGTLRGMRTQSNWNIFQRMGNQ
ncbi:hypothetical protein K439DRAFT_375921 [Ramaria rubella]|nr:hypothetical protein K439DRAFT_375921 [Ramaria rubella]